MRSICILGVTGSIGKSALDVIRANKDKFYLKGISTTGRKKNKIIEIIKEFNPEFVATEIEIGVKDYVKNYITGSGFNEKLISYCEADVYLIAISGIAGILPTYKAVKTGRIVAIANKESIVSAGRFIIKEAEKAKTTLIPVDSEHSAIFQCLQGQDRNALRRIILTATGGPFLDYTQEELEKVTVEDALRHPVWNMGKKITIDSATLMNKGLEMIEAYYLFKVEPKAIDVLIHREGIIHSMVEFKDGAIIAQLGIPDMRIPIAFALSYPERLETNAGYLDFNKVGKLTFFEPDYSKFPLLRICKEALKKQKESLFITINTANEVAVKAFLEGKIKFTDIHRIVELTLEKANTTIPNSIDDVLKLSKEVERLTNLLIGI
ncbi:MAG: 1-deoxy-D-xylulose-5-phosphate reductoisomerase [candidate division WOR-3 bacterium]